MTRESASEREIQTVLIRLIRDQRSGREQQGNPQDNRFAAVINECVSRGLAEQTMRTVKVSDAGLAWLRRKKADQDPFQEQHQDRHIVSLDAPHDDGVKQNVAVNANAGPLLWLHRRKDVNGAPLISEIQVKAGQRFAAELARGQIVPGFARSSATEQLRVDGGRQGQNAADALSGCVIQARQNTNKAMQFLGPDLAAVAVDVCHYEISLKDIERKRGWPVRSAKVVLNIALDRLASHYGYISDAGHA